MIHLFATVLVLQGSISDTILSKLYVQAQLPRYSYERGQGGTVLSGRRPRLEALRQLGFRGTGIPVEWGRIESARGRPDWSRLDSVVNEVRGLRLAIYGLITYSATWAVPPALASVPRIDAHRPVVDGSAARGDTLFAAFAAGVARRYRGRIDRWEIWNEENHPDFWFNMVEGSNRGASAADYGRLFTLTRDSILAANPGAQVAVGGLASFTGRGRALPDQLAHGRTLWALPAHQFLRELFKLGLRPAAVAIHPYSVVPPGARLRGDDAPVFPDQVVDSVFAVLEEAGMSTTRVWVTEWGVDARPDLEEDLLDRWFRDALRDLLCRSRIEFVTLYALTDESRTHFGLFHQDGGRTVAGDALGRVLENWSGCGAVGH